jgi:DNA-directed primase/polymerase protein
MQPSERHYYELIQQGMPCHLYFDIEFEKDINPDVNGDELLSIFKSYIVERISDSFKTTAEVIDLDSTTEKKFSRHLIYRIKGK